MGKNVINNHRPNRWVYVRFELQYLQCGECGKRIDITDLRAAEVQLLQRREGGEGGDTVD